MTMGKTDSAHKGMVKVTKGTGDDGVEGWILPSSVNAFTRNGWVVAEESEAPVETQPSATETTATSEAAASGTEGKKK